MLITSTLFPEQVPAVKKGSRKKHCLNTMKTGQGKTIVELAIAKTLFDRGIIDMVLIFTPKTGYEKRVWASEVNKHTDSKAVSLEDFIQKMEMHSPKKLASVYSFVFAKHTHVKAKTLKGKPFNVLRHIRQILTHLKVFIILDEVHAFKNRNSELTLRMRPLLAKAVGVHGLTATPLSRSLEDTYNIIDLVRPAALGSFDYFKKAYCDIHMQVIGRNHFGGLRKVEVIQGFSDEKLFNSVIDNFVIKGESLVRPEFHFFNYTPSYRERHIYSKIADGISQTGDLDEGWIKHLMNKPPPSTNEVTEAVMQPDLVQHSSRFIYLQYAADGIIKDNGDLGDTTGAKFKHMLDITKTIIEKKQSVIIYFAYYASLETFEYLLRQELTVKGTQCKILKSTGKNTLGEHEVTEKSVKVIPTIILATKAGSESVSYYFINNILFGNYPTVPDTITQLVGRITRANTLFRDDLHVFMPRAHNIDNYKLFVVSHKTGLMEKISGEEGNVPKLFKDMDWKPAAVKRYKNKLLWGK